MDLQLCIVLQLCMNANSCYLYVTKIPVEVPDEGFPGRAGCANLLFGKTFAENCMKIKEIIGGAWIRH